MSDERDVEKRETDTSEDQSMDSIKTDKSHTRPEKKENEQKEKEKIMSCSMQKSESGHSDVVIYISFRFSPISTFTSTTLISQPRCKIAATEPTPNWTLQCR